MFGGGSYGAIEYASKKQGALAPVAIVRSIGTFIVLSVYQPNYLVMLSQMSFIIQTTDSIPTNFAIKYT